MEVMIDIHSYLRWAVLILLIVSILKAFQGKSKGTTFNEKDGKFFLITMAVTHIQILLGISLYFMSAKVSGAMGIEGGMMKDAVARFWGMEHIAGMLIAIIIITIGYSKSKKITDAAKRYKKIGMFYTLGLVIILVSIPWPFRQVGILEWI